MTFSDCVEMCTFSCVRVCSGSCLHKHTRMKNRTRPHRRELPHAVRAHTHPACEATVDVCAYVRWPVRVLSRNVERVCARCVLHVAHGRTTTHTHRTPTQTHTLHTHRHTHTSSSSPVVQQHRMCTVHIRACAHPIIINVPGTVHNGRRVHYVSAYTALQLLLCGGSNSIGSGGGGECK